METKPHVNMFADLQVRYAAPLLPVPGIEEPAAAVDPIISTICQACRKKLKETPSSNQNILLPKYFCGYCHRKLQHKHSLWMHLIHHTASMQRPPYTCPLCNKVFDTLSGYKLHLGSLHGVKPSNDCPHCPVKFIDRKMFEQHLQLHQIPIAKETRNKPVTHLLEFHQSIVCPDCLARLQHVCTLCREIFNRKEELRHHLLDVHFHCPMCGGYFVKKREMFNHLRKFHNNLDLENCDICSSLMVDVEDPQCKIRTRPKTNPEQEFLEKLGKQVFKCHTCRTYFLGEEDKALEKSNSQQQTNKRKFCKHCHQVDNTKKRRKIHNDADGKMECNECDQQFDCIEDIRKHMKVHYEAATGTPLPEVPEEEEETFYPCNVCTLEYGSQASLDLHIKANHHYCLYCCVAFHEKSHLILHVITSHLENSPVICECCRQAYSNMYQTDVNEAMKQANGIQFIAPPIQDTVDMAESIAETTTY